MSTPPPSGTDLLTALQHYLPAFWVGLYDNDAEASDVTGLALAAGGGTPGANPLEEASPAEVPGYGGAYPGDWKLTKVSDTVVRLTGTAVFACSEAPATEVDCYGWFLACPQVGADTALVAFSVLDPQQAFAGAGDTITVPVSVVFSQSDPMQPATAVVDSDGVGFTTNTGGEAPTVHTKSDVQFAKWQWKQLGRYAGHDARATAPRRGRERSSPLPVIGTDARLSQAVSDLRARLSALHQMWTGRPLV